MKIKIDRDESDKCLIRRMINEFRTAEASTQFYNRYQ
jgi:hypothetical protein